jgi:homoserine kinase
MERSFIEHNPYHTQKPCFWKNSIFITMWVMEIMVTIPATTANLGPGFDCLGMALALHNQVTFSVLESGLEVHVQGEGADSLPVDNRNLVVQAAERVFAHLGHRPAGLRVQQQNHIPVGSGLGSSAAAVLGGLLAANDLVNGDLAPADLLRMAVEMEGHPDNVAAAYYGGLVVVNQDGDQYHVDRVAMPPMKVVLVLPQVSLSTAAARAVLPGQVSLADAVFNTGRVAALVRPWLVPTMPNWPGRRKIGGTKHIGCR